MKVFDEATKAVDDDIMNQVERLWVSEDAKLFDILDGIWITSAQLGFFTADGIFDLGLSWDVVRDEWLTAIQQFGAEKVTLINDFTKESIREALLEGVQEGDSIPSLAERIQEVFTEADKVRATRIARTETHMATNGGTFTTYYVAGFKQKEWLTAIDGREREWHAAMDGQIVGISEPFISGQGNQLMYPGDPDAPAEEVINCRCVMVPVT